MEDSTAKVVQLDTWDSTYRARGDGGSKFFLHLSKR